MESYKREFIKFLEDAGVLKFGDFTAKSGRKIPIARGYGKALHNAYFANIFNA